MAARIAKKPPVVREAVILESVMRYLRICRDVAWVRRINTGAARLKGFHVRFGFPGCSDIIGQLMDGRFLAVECKAADTKPTPEQQDFIDRVNRHGGLAGVARSIDDVDALLAKR